MKLVKAAVKIFSFSFLTALISIISLKVLYSALHENYFGQSAVLTLNRGQSLTISSNCFLIAIGEKHFELHSTQEVIVESDQESEEMHWLSPTLMSAGKWELEEGKQIILLLFSPELGPDFYATKSWEFGWRFFSPLIVVGDSFAIFYLFFYIPAWRKKRYA